jgi:hypothetical protein
MHLYNVVRRSVIAYHSGTDLEVIQDARLSDAVFESSCDGIPYARQAPDQRESVRGQ